MLCRSMPDSRYLKERMLVLRVYFVILPIILTRFDADPEQEMVPDKQSSLFTCPRCGYQDSFLHAICPECERPYQRDYIDTRLHPRDPDLTGVCTSRFWARVALVVLAVAAGFWFVMEVYSVVG